MSHGLHAPYLTASGFTLLCEHYLLLHLSQQMKETTRLKNNFDKLEIFGVVMIPASQ